MIRLLQLKGFLLDFWLDSFLQQWIIVKLQLECRAHTIFLIQAQKHDWFSVCNHNFSLSSQCSCRSGGLKNVRDIHYVTHSDDFHLSSFGVLRASMNLMNCFPQWDAIIMHSARVRSTFAQINQISSDLFQTSTRSYLYDGTRNDTNINYTSDCTESWAFCSIFSLNCFLTWRAQTNKSMRARTATLHLIYVTPALCVLCKTNN